MRKMMLVLAGLGLMVLSSTQVALAGGFHHGYRGGCGPRYGVGYAPYGRYATPYRGYAAGYPNYGYGYAATPYGYGYGAGYAAPYGYGAGGLGLATRNFSFFVAP